MKQKRMHRILIRGGILSPRELLEICKEVAKNNVDYISLGSRQDILLQLDEEHLNDLEPIFTNKIVKLSKTNNSNISSSYVSADIFRNNSWLTAATYLYILESFDYNPKLKVNIVDPCQNLVPLFYGQINVISSDFEDYWYLFLRNQKWNDDDYYPVLIHTNDIALVIKTMEDHWEETTSISNLFDTLNDKIQTQNRTFNTYISSPLEPFPYYEGMHRYGIEKFWLGLYWRNNKYDVSFLHSIAELCLDTGIANICISPWKSLIIKDIPKNSKLAWECLLGSRGINVRHSQLEMNWHLPAGDQRALEFKKYIVNELDSIDISTYGLTIGIFLPDQIPFTAISIIRNTSNDDTTTTYQVKYAERFNPSNLQYHLFAQDVVMEAIPVLITELSQMYFKALEDNSTAVKQPSKKKTVPPQTKIVHQCQKCMNIYDQIYGDILQNIPPSLHFADLPSNYSCFSCGSPKLDFNEISVPMDIEVLKV